MKTQKDECCECPCTPCTHETSQSSMATAPLIIAGAILLGSVIISGSIFAFSNKFSDLGEAIGKKTETLADAGTTTKTDTNTKPTLATANTAPDLSSIGVQLSVDGNYKKEGATPPVDGLPFLGNKDAKVTIVEFSDFECPFCHGYYQDVFLQMKKDYIDTGKVKFIYKDFPLYTIHPRAAALANAAHCAENISPDSYYTFHNAVFDSFDKWRTAPNLKESLLSIATSLNLNKDAFDSCISNFDYKTLIEKNITHGYAWGVRGTPTTFINDQEIKGLADYASMKTVIEAELKKKG